MRMRTRSNWRFGGMWVVLPCGRMQLCGSRRVVALGGGGVVPNVGACLDLCVGGGDRPDPGHGPCGRPAALDPLRQAEHGQYQVVARPPRGCLGQGECRGLVSRLKNAPEDLVRGGGVRYWPWWGGPWGEHGVGPLHGPLWAGGLCCGGHYVVVRARGLCTRPPAGVGRCL